MMEHKNRENVSKYTYVHGGDIFRGGIDLDLSVNINPFGMPESARRAAAESMDRWEQYPDALQRNLRNRMSESLRQEGFPVRTDSLLFGNGASDLLYSIFQALRPERVLIPIPGFSEYRKAAETVGAEITGLPVFSAESVSPYDDDAVLAAVRAFAEHLPPVSGMVILCNPNNPDGHVRTFDFVRRIFGICQKYGMILLVDESFLWFCTDGKERSALSLWRCAGHEPEPSGLIVLNAFTKIFAMAGLRLGFMIADPVIIRQTEELRQPWSVSVPAEEAGIACLAEREFVRKTSGEIQIRRNELRSRLTALGMRCAESFADFVLFRTEIRDLGDRLQKKGILIRDCSNYAGLGEGWYRAAVKTQESCERLAAEIGAIKKENAEKDA
ncbi:Histidinol-phosphate/aromatic aminotransferase or cobyric acid decarboxylase [[Clostridium] aminophilum]|uniref:Histidinol-phosphate/aromatic aminotransferase or cobyric acid decarboxylase n=1 Tax=[Clostridium] aminophilum TaxID=1526 RepID=A0A1I0BL44_9FIRM|nr:histidinol-phosphate transaminase [[Clostridium] aminophilum]SET07378.1 Histidinol-phosphate/aromatic aminotransferase or cobyric acid decarboxylase [[Clostridium] aminophilum]